MRTIAETIIFLLKIDTKSPYLNSMSIQMLPKGYFDCITVATNVSKVIVEACTRQGIQKTLQCLQSCACLALAQGPPFDFFYSLHMKVYFFGTIRPLLNVREMSIFVKQLIEIVAGFFHSRQ